MHTSQYKYKTLFQIISIGNIFKKNSILLKINISSFKWGLLKREWLFTLKTMFYHLIYMDIYDTYLKYIKCPNATLALVYM